MEKSRTHKRALDLDKPIVIERALRRASHYMLLANRTIADLPPLPEKELEALASMPSLLLLHDCLWHGQELDRELRRLILNSKDWLQSKQRNEPRLGLLVPSNQD